MTCAKGLTSGYMPLGAVVAGAASRSRSGASGLGAGVPPRLHLRRASGRLRSRSREPRDHRARGAARARVRARAGARRGGAGSVLEDPIVAEVRCAGLLAGVELPVAALAAEPRLPDDRAARALDHGLISALAARGRAAALAGLRHERGRARRDGAAAARGLRRRDAAPPTLAALDESRREADAARARTAAAVPGCRAGAAPARSRAAAEPGRGRRADRRRGVRGGARRASATRRSRRAATACSGRPTCSTGSRRWSCASRSRRCSATARACSCLHDPIGRDEPPPALPDDRRPSGSRGAPAPFAVRQRGPRCRSASPRTSTSSRPTRACASTAPACRACGLALPGRRARCIRAGRERRGAPVPIAGARVVRGHGGLLDGAARCARRPRGGARSSRASGGTWVPERASASATPSCGRGRARRRAAGIAAGFGSTMRDGLGVRAERGGVEIAITGVLLLDPLLGVRLTSIGIGDGRVVGDRPRGQSGHDGRRSRSCSAPRTAVFDGAA